MAGAPQAPADHTGPPASRIWGQPPTRSPPTVYSLLIALGVSVPLTLSLLLIPERPHYFLGPFLGLVTFFPIFMLLSRQVSNKVAPFLEQAQRQIQAGNVPQAVQSFEKALAYKNWQFFLEKQLFTQIGILHYGASDEKKAVEYLEQGYPKVSETPLILGVIQYRQRKLDEARQTLEYGIKFNKKSAILYNVLAWMLAKEGQRDEAIAVLTRGMKALKSHEATADNLDRLRNGKKMNMKALGQHWYMCKFEAPPGMSHMAQPVRKGFRQPPKRKGKAKKR